MTYPPPPPTPDIEISVEIREGGPAPRPNPRLKNYPLQGSKTIQYPNKPTLPPVPARRIDCRLSHYIYQGGAGRSYCTEHPVGECPFGVPPYPTRVPMSWWRRFWLAFQGY